MASSSEPKRIHDVVFSFDGSDVLNSFLNDLYKALNQNGLHTFIDREELRKGDKMQQVLMKAIEESSIAIIIFSKDYASSPWCLDVLVKIMECKEQKDLIVLPVFYEVDPREVRQGTQSYGRAFAQYESKFGKDSEKVNIWKKALSDAGNLSGWHSNNGLSPISSSRPLFRSRSPPHDEGVVRWRTGQRRRASSEGVWSGTARQLQEPCAAAGGAYKAGE